MKLMRSHIALLSVSAFLITAGACKKSDSKPATVVYYDQADQIGRPAINTVFITMADKDKFNTTIPTAQPAAFQPEMKTTLLALNPDYTTNLLTLTADQFMGVLSTDVLNVSTTDPTTYYNGTQVLTGRTLSDDVIDVSLILVFGGPDATEKPGLTSDHVDANDKVFLSTFPYLATPF